MALSLFALLSCGLLGAVNVTFLFFCQQSTIAPTLLTLFNCGLLVPLGTSLRLSSSLMTITAVPTSIDCGLLECVEAFELSTILTSAALFGSLLKHERLRTR